MPRISPVDPAHIVGRGHMLLAEVRHELGFVPNLMRVLAHSPAALTGYLALRSALREGELPAGLRELIAIAVAGANGCDACLASHTQFGRAAGLGEDELTGAVRSYATDPAVAAVFRFVNALIDQRGHVGDDVLMELRQAGFSDAAIIEIVTVVAANQFANYINNLASVVP